MTGDNKGPMMPDGGSGLLTEKAAARWLTLSERTLQNLRLKGGGPRYVKMNGRIAYMAESLREWALAREQNSTCANSRGASPK